MALRVLSVLAEVVNSGEMASSGYLRKRCGLSAEEWHGNGELLASLVCFAAEKGFLEWHAKDMVGATDDNPTAPSERAERTWRCMQPSCRHIKNTNDDLVCRGCGTLRRSCETR